MTEIYVKSSLPFTFTSYKDAENFAGFVSSVKGSVADIRETINILDEIEEFDYNKVPQTVTDSWDLDIVCYYSELTRELLIFAVETLRDYVETEIQMYKKMKSDREKSEKK